MSEALDRFSTEHRRVSALLGAALRESGAPAQRRIAFDAFAAKLRHHLELEERRIFPAVDQLVGDPQFALTATLRREHAVLREQLDEVDRNLRSDARAAAAGNLRELQAMLAAHERKERHVLYPMADRALDESEVELRALLDDPTDD